MCGNPTLTLSLPDILQSLFCWTATENTLKRAEQAWNEAASAVRVKLNLLAAGMPMDDLVDMLLIFLVSGSMTKSMETILIEDLTEHGLKRLADDVDTSLQLVNELVLGHIQVSLNSHYETFPVHGHKGKCSAA